MDYLPRPPDSNIPHIEVPYITSLQYDFLGFKGFPARHGYTRDGALNDQLPVEELAALLQSWLYFGLVAEFTGRVVRQEDLVMKTENSSLVTGALILVYLHEWIYSLRRLAVVSSRWVGAVDRAREVLMYAIDASVWFDYIPGMGNRRYAAIALSVKSLIITLASIYGIVEPKHMIGDRIDVLRPWITPTNTLMPLPADYLHSLMRKHGCCPSLVRRICKRQNYCTAIYLMQLQATTISTSIQHTSCSFTSCLAYNTNEESYITRHINAQCSCAFVSVDTGHVASLVEAGRVPVISTKLGPNNKLEVGTADWVNGPIWGHLELRFWHYRGPFIAYAAISHVWADGLGNSEANAIPLCQFTRIVSQIDLGGGQGNGSMGATPPWFWMDTLCVPVGNAHYTTRLKAIDYMAMIYASASHTIVLDNTLATLAFPSLGPIQWDDCALVGVSNNTHVAMRASQSYLKAATVPGHILCSPWAGRSWTLQEAVLSERLHFALRDGSLLPEWLGMAATTGMNTVRTRSGRDALDTQEKSVQRPTVYVARCAKVAVGLCCIRQALCALQHSRRDHRSTPLALCYEPKILLKMLLLSAVLLGAVEIFCSLVMYLALIGAYGIAASIVVVVLLLVIICPIALIVLCVKMSLDGMSTARSTLLGDLLMPRRQGALSDIHLRSNKLPDLLCLFLFRSLARETEHMLHRDSKVSTSVSRNRMGVLSRTRCLHFARVWENLAERSTSKPEDVHYILGTLTHLRIQPLRLLSARERMRRILRSFEELPLGLLFIHEDRLQDTNEDYRYDWLPRVPCGDRLALTDGLFVTERGYEFVVDSQTNGLRLLLLERFPHACSSFLVQQQDSNLAYRARFLSGYRAHCVCSPTECGHEHCIAFVRPIVQRPQDRQTTTATLFRVLNRSEAYMRLRFSCHLDWESVPHERLGLDSMIPAVGAVLVPRVMRCCMPNESNAMLGVADGTGETDIEVAPETKLLYKPPFTLVNTPAHQTLNILIWINASPVYACAMWAVYHHRSLCHSLAWKLGMTTLLTTVFLGLVLLGSSVRDYCRSTAWELHYGTEQVRRPRAAWVRINAWMEAWDECIAANFAIADGTMASIEEQGSYTTSSHILLQEGGSILQYVTGQGTGVYRGGYRTTDDLDISPMDDFFSRRVATVKGWLI